MRRLWQAAHRGSRATLRLLLLAVALGGPSSAEDAPGEGQIHEVQRGETLSVIAQNTLGDASLWPALYEANRDQIKDPSRVYPGQRLAVPRVDRARREALRREADGLATP